MNEALAKGGHRISVIRPAERVEYPWQDCRTKASADEGDIDQLFVLASRHRIIKIARCEMIQNVGVELHRQRIKGTVLRLPGWC